MITRLRRKLRRPRTRFTARLLLVTTAFALAFVSILHAVADGPAAPVSPDPDSAAWHVFTTPELPPEAPFVSSLAGLGLPSLACGPHSRLCAGWARAAADGR